MKAYGGLGAILWLMASLWPLTGPAAAPAEDAELTHEVYVDIPPFSVTMYHRGAPRGSLTITARLKILDKDQRAVARKYLPRLNNAYVMAANRLSHDYFDVSRPVNVAMLGDAFQRRTDKILGHDGAKVLIADVAVYQR